MQKRDWFVFPVVVLAIIIFSGLLFYIVRGAADSQWYGFGVDSIGRVYIGKPMQIDVYQDGVFLSSIEIPKSRTYYFTVQEDDTILLSTSVDAYIFDFSGRELSCKPDKRCSIYNRLQWLREVETGNGEHFYFRESFGRRIIEDEEGEDLL